VSTTKQPCPDCGSSDALTIYDNGTYCFSCKKSTFNDTNTEDTTITNNTTAIGDYATLPITGIINRGLSKEICAKYGVRTEVDTENGMPYRYLYPYHRDGELVAFKVRHAEEKVFYAVGSMSSDIELFGQHLAGDGGRMIIITEGENDCLAASQMLLSVGKNYRVVSLPNGANTNAIKSNLEWLESFDTVVLNLDSDDVGVKTTAQACDLFTPGKVKVMALPCKDANEMLQSDEYRDVDYLHALNRAKVYQPDGIVSGIDTWELYNNRPKVDSVAFPDDWEDLNRMTYGMRLGELDTWTSGSGMGKTQVMRELQYHLLNQVDDNIGIISLEEPLLDSVEALMAIDLNKRIHLPDVQSTEEELHGAWENTSGTGRLYFYDSFGSMDNDSLVSKIRYFANGLGCRYIFLDHLSIVVSEFASEGGERERIDSIMTRLKNLTQELNIWIGLVVHLRKTSGGTSFEEGAVPSLDDLRGSGSIKQLSNSVYALSRNQQAPDTVESNTSQLHVLKCRFSGRNGSGDYLYFDDQTGRMVKVEEPEQINEDF
jgi:twinkle protein